MPQSAYQLAENLSLFSELSQNERKELAVASRVRQLKKGERLFHHGDKCTSFFIVGEGAIKIHRETPEGKGITLHIAIVGDTLGDNEMFEHKSTYLASAEAVEDSVLLEYPIGWILQKIREHSGLALNMLAAVSKCSSRMTVDREHIVTLKTPQRVGCFLLRLCDLHQLNPSKFTLPYSKSTIASKLGMEPESFSRALAKLKEIGVTVSGSEISITDIIALDEYTCRSCSISEDCETCNNTLKTYAPKKYADKASGGQ